ncbi:MAG: hypothetical protein H6Q59_875 [Firmicutes bacterium]|nr:hypothetical protein [Bacillota bacterium]
MLTRQFSLEQMPDYPFDQDYDISKLVFFDIETTGFAADSTYLYLIGCAYYKDGSFQLIQWFCEDIREEAAVISSFFGFLKDYEVLLHYNGTGFDLPYLQRKCALLQLDYSFQDLKSIDIYKKIGPYKKIFRLNNYKQKTIETFLNIHRTDTFGGGDLIQIYQSYLGKKHFESLRSQRDPGTVFDTPSEAEILLRHLLLHNEDDLRGLIRISPVLAYSDLFERPIRILSAGVDGGSFTIQFESSASLPVRVSFGNDLAHFTAIGNSATLTVQVYEGELKHFYDNYKDYYYLTAEDSVIHKSLAHFVDKEYRVKAKPSNCYTKKQGIFAPQYELLFTPCFKLDHQSKLSFLEIHTDFLLQEENLEKYVTHILNTVIAKGN